MSKMNAIPTVQVGALEKKNLLEHLPQFQGKKILIVGDIGLDEYVMGEVRRISPEAPVPVLDVEKEDLRLGLAGNVAQNISSLGGTPLLVSVMGQDRGAELLSQLFKAANVDSSHIIIDEQRPTTRKMRVMAKHHHLVRVDYELRKDISAQTEAKLLQKIQSLLPQSDLVILQDYAKGLITASLSQKLIELSHKAGKKVFVDPHRSSSVEFYKGADLIKPNFDESVVLSGLSYDELRDHPDKVIEVGRGVQKKTGAKELVMTRGKDGMTIFSGDQILQVPTYARQVFDVTGAGDTVIATLALACSSGLPLSSACVLANYAAGVVVGQVGCVPCTLNDLKSYMA